MRKELEVKHKFPYNWTLKDANFTKDKGKVFSCFACGGGSSFGYKLAGFDVIGHNDIDKKMIEVYKENHKPKYSFLESITTFAKRKDLPKELYELDILDGSPPCSSFSMAGNREKDWGKEKVFREGQAEQVLDTLFFDFVYEVVREKMIIGNNEFSDSDISIFFKNKQLQDGKVAKWTDATLNRLGKTYKTMLFESGMTDKGTPRIILKPILDHKHAQ